MILTLVILLSNIFYSQTQLITRDFDWMIYRTKNFDIYHTKDGIGWLAYLEKILEGAYEKGKREYNPKLDKRISFFFYTASKYFQQNSISEVGEGTGGFTEPYKDRFLVYSDGSKRWLRYVIYHEFGHEIQFSILVDGWWESPRIAKLLFYPLWMLEGLSENMTDDWELALEDMYVRDYFLDGKLPSLEKLFGFGHLKPHQVTLAYKTGAKAIRFLKEEYGFDKPSLLLYYWKDSYDINTVLKKLIGINLDEFDYKFREYLAIRYLDQINEKNLTEAYNYGIKITSDIDDIPIFNTSPVFINDEKIAYLSTIKGSPSIVIEDLSNSKKIVLDKNFFNVDYIPYSKFSLPVRHLSISNDRRYLIFSARKKHKDFICLYDLKKSSFKKVLIDEADEISHPTISMDGSKILFSAMKNSFYDVYEVDFDEIYNSDVFNIRNAKKITNDNEYEMSAQYGKDGEIFFICEWEENEKIKNAICKVKDGIKEKVFDFLDVADFYYDRKNDEFYIISDNDGVYNLYLYDKQKLYKMTSVVGGVFTPYVEGEKVYFSYFRHGSMHIYEAKKEYLKYEVIKDLNLEINEYKNDYGLNNVEYDLRVEKYKTKFSADLFFPAFLYSSEGGFFVFNYLQFSDYTSRHSFSILTNYNSRYSYLDLRLSYLYNRYRVKFFTSSKISTYKNDIDEPYYTKRLLLSNFGFIYPLSLKSQFYLVFNIEDDEKEYYHLKYKPYDERKRGVTLAYSKNDLNGLYLTVVDGYSFSTLLSVYGYIFGSNKSYLTFSSNYTKYYPISRKSTFANRFAFGFSSGRDYLLYSFNGINGIRGMISSKAKTKRLFLYNSEFRFPISSMDFYMSFMFPDFYFKALYLKIFCDNAYYRDYVFDKYSFSNSIGFGFDFYTFILQAYRMVISVDFSKNTKDGSYITYLYLGPIF